MAAGAESPPGRVAAAIGVADGAIGVADGTDGVADGADGAGRDSGVDVAPDPTPRARDVGAGLLARADVGGVGL